MTHEYDTPSKVIEYYGDPALSHDENERLISLAVYGGRIRLEKSPGQPLTVEELRAWVTKRGLPPGYLPWMAVNIEDVLRELRRPRPVLVKP
jgi:hypothetical protein